MKLRKLFESRRAFALLIAMAIFVCAAFALRSSLSKGNESVMESKVEEARPVVYVAIGDSTGVGVGAREGGYVVRLFERIKRERAGSSLKNLCVSGATTDDLLRTQLAPATSANPTLVTVGIGINDIGHGITPEKFSRNYEEIIKRLRAKTQARIVVSNLPDVSLAPAIPSYWRAEAHARVLEFNRRIAEIAGRHGLLVVDAYSATHELIPTHPEFFSADGFH
ncbi:MAG: SGNH/GDSL hydrolase family protein, partial [Pyrinomonadaceae bacterium]